MWKIRAGDVKAIGRTPGGDQFTEFVDSLIFGWAHLHGLSCSEIHTNNRTNKQDGGVDTKVCQPIDCDPLGWMVGNPTIWQYKATDSSEVGDGDIQNEIKKWYTIECIEQGFAYRFCICDSIPDYKRESWERLLNSEIKKIRVNAPDAKVLSADDLAQWASCIPSIKLHYFIQGITMLGLHFKAWGEGITGITPEFIRNPLIDGIIDRIQNHVNFAVDVPDVVLPISGLSGVGKTRLVYESLLACEGAKSLTIFTNDEDKAVDIAMTISNNSTINVILVADECGIEKRLKLNELLKGSKDRARVIAIDNSGERPASYSPELWLEKMPPEIVEEILAKNYPSVPAERRRAYADLSSGFVRFAADLCHNDSMIASAGSVDPALIVIKDYLRARFSPDELKVIEALSLITKVGYKGDVSQELLELCETVNQEPQHFREIADRLHDGPGFVAKAGRYLYITPEIIAQVGLDLGWNTWVKDDPQDFLKKLPKNLLEPFYMRVRKSASTEAREIIGGSFRKWSTGLGSGQLNSVETINRLVTLIEVEPGTYLPILRRLIEAATIDDLKIVSGENISGSYGPRRSIVWLAERIVAFPEYFDDAENILLRLGLAESEKNIANNATAIWRQLFRIFLSGTAIPFLDRLNRLEQRILCEDKDVSRFAVGALDGIFNDHPIRTAGPSIVAGKIPPQEYVPNDNNEYSACISAAIALLGKLINREDISDDIRQIIKSILVDNTRTLLNQGFSDELWNVLPERSLDDDLKSKLIGNIEKFLYFDTKAKWGRPALKEDYIEKVNKWLISLKPSNLEGRISILLRTLPGHYSIVNNDDKLESEIKSLAKECLQYPEYLMKEKAILFSLEAKNAVNFGYGIGTVDEKAIFLDFVIESSIRYNSTEFGRGYISGLLGSYPHHADIINKKIDEIQMDYPAIAYELFMARIDITRALERTLKLVDSEKLSALYLGRFGFGKDEYLLAPDNFEKILLRLVDASDNGNSLALQAALEFVSFRIFREKKGKIGQIFDLVDIRSLAWRLIERTPEKDRSYQWIQTLEALSKYDLPRAANLIALSLVEGNLHNMGDFDAFLGSFAKSNPDLLMRSVGEVMLDKRLSWKFQIFAYKSLFKSLPEETIIEWIREHGAEAARLLARHLPSPYISEEGLPIVPHLTQFILDTFEDDDEVFNAFLCGMHAYQVYSGDIAAQHEKEAEIARKFSNHSSKRIREWAQFEEEAAHSEAERWRLKEEERKLY